uniref:Uncharacterized protein n=1 Tax=Romanomermis culicivorax TaxID=13658 RepID=A0A915ISD9_ROMCU
MDIPFVSTPSKYCKAVGSTSIELKLINEHIDEEDESINVSLLAPRRIKPKPFLPLGMTKIRGMFALNPNIRKLGYSADTSNLPYHCPLSSTFVRRSTETRNCYCTSRPTNASTTCRSHRRRRFWIRGNVFYYCSGAGFCRRSRFVQGRLTVQTAKVQMGTAGHDGYDHFGVVWRGGGDSQRGFWNTKKGLYVCKC